MGNEMSGPHLPAADRFLPGQSLLLATKQIHVVGANGFQGSFYALDQNGAGQPAGGKPPRNLWQYVNPAAQNWWVTVLAAGVPTNNVAPYDDNSKDGWNGFPAGTIIISYGPAKAGSTYFAHVHSATIATLTPINAPDRELNSNTHGAALAAGGPYVMNRDFTLVFRGYNYGRWRQLLRVVPIMSEESEEEEEEEEEEIERKWPCEACAEESPGPCHLYLLDPYAPTYLPHSSCINGHIVRGPFYYKYARCEVCACTRARNARDRARNALEDIDHVQLAIESVGCDCYDPFGENTCTYTGDCFSGLDGDEDAFVP